MNVEDTNRVFKAFADPTRLRIVNILTQGEFCVCELVEVLGMSQPKTSRHLAHLRRAGLVRGRKEGVWMHYSLDPKRAGSLGRTLVSCVEGCLQKVDMLKKDTAKARRIRRERSVARA